MVCLAKVAEEGYESELDMFYARACIDFLLRCNELAKTKYILECAQQSVGSTPILNFVQFLLVGIQEGDYEFVKKLVLQDYAAVLKRDGLLFDKIDKICERAFGG